ncbi:PP2C family protein-serine/threonine phosphatase [Falsiroseomonas sp.]|uniref:PP2C family protein-serine/threonine phosphatase n=1 Tax=Falsiroseomonas sp. TaxID=2870721 RepID=UPI0035621840
MTGMWSVACAAVSHAGHVRRVNEDAWLARPEAGLFAVADGMGGHQRGDIASRMVIDALATLPPAPDARTMRDRVETSLAAVNRALQQTGGGAGGVSGSTVVVLLMCGRHFAVLWAGDSRAYRAGPDGFAQVTRDHSLVQELVDRGALTREAARGHPMSSRITRAVGVAPELVLEGVQGELRAGDAFLLCSDGLTRHVADAEIRSALEALPPEAAAERLLELTLARGATDNVTVLVLHIRPGDGTGAEPGGDEDATVVLREGMP